MIKQMKIWCYKELSDKEKKGLYSTFAIIILLIAIRLFYQVIRKDVFGKEGASLLLDIVTVLFLFVIAKELVLITKLLIFNRPFKLYLLPRMLYERDQRDFNKAYQPVYLDSTGVVLCHKKGIKYYEKWKRKQEKAFEEYEDYDGFYSSFEGKKKAFNDVEWMLKEKR